MPSEPSPRPLSRREWLGKLLARGEPPPPAQMTAPQAAGAAPAGGAMMAVISGRFCLAYAGTVCTACYDHCPEPGAIVITDGLPRVVLEKCTGCRICHEECPAPTNAILMVPRPPER